jgi:hypothetical protein
MSSRVTSASDPAYAAMAVTPSDVDNLPSAALGGLYVIVAGNVSFIDMNGVTHSLLAVPAFTRIPIQVRRVRATGTAATVLALCS